MILRRIAFLVALLSVRPVSAARSSSPAALDIRVAFDQSAYQLRISDTEFSYVEGPLRLSGRVRPCNRSIYRALASAYRARRTAVRTQPATDYDVAVTDGSASNSVARGGTLGTWLRRIPSRITYVHVDAEVACHR